MPTRRLAAIMFTDMVGYTALMDRNEQEALKLLDKNRWIHHQSIKRFGGKILKEMGDGIMASFPTTYDAIICSATIVREASQENYKLRIGLHEGEVVVKQGDIFGEGVNIASRMEALAEPGQILITESVYRNIRNKPGISTKSIGEKKLKNVSEPWRIYEASLDDQLINEALAGDSSPDRMDTVSKEPKVIAKLLKWIIIGFAGVGMGAVIWMNLSSTNRVEGFTNEEVRLLKEKTVTVLPFQGPTDGWLGEFGKMAPYWIHKSLVEVTDGKVVDAGSAEKYEDIPTEFIQRVGLDMVVEGRYFIMDRASDDLELFVDLIDLKTAEKQSLGHFVGSSSNPEAILEEVTQKIMAIWALDGRKRFADRPPRYDAYTEYEASSVTWGKDWDASIDHLSRAYALDTTFYEALLSIASAYFVMGGHDAEGDSVINFILKKDLDLDPWTAMRLKWFEYHLEGNLEQKANIGYQMAEFDPMDWRSAHNAVWSAKSVNMRGLALMYSDRFWQIAPDPICEGSNFWGTNFRFESYFALGQYYQILEEVISLDCVPHDMQLLALTLKACVRMGDLAMIDTLLDRYNQSSKGLNNAQWDYLIEAVVKDLFMTGEQKLMGPYVNHLAQSTNGYWHWGMFFQGDYDLPIKKMQDRIMNDSTNYFNWGHLAFMLAYSGDTSSVRQLVALLGDRAAGKYDWGYRTYYLGVLHALLGQEGLATKLLIEAFNQGYYFGFHRYNDDFRLYRLFDYPPFQEFVKPGEHIE